jgi:hypothetical protein
LAQCALNAVFQIKVILSVSSYCFHAENGLMVEYAYPLDGFQLVFDSLYVGFQMPFYVLVREYLFC